MTKLSSTALGISFLMLLGAVCWLWAYTKHRHVQPGASNAIRLPRVLCVLLGNFRSDGLCSIDGALFQICIYVFVPLLTLMVLKIVSHQTVVDWMGTISFVGVVLKLTHYYIAKRGAE
jgi:hypothetical protein